VEASLLSAARTRYLCSFKTFGHVITLYSCGTNFGILRVITCVVDPSAHVIYAFGFAYKTGCDKVVSDPC
jgi:hypothetical protein